MIDIEVRLALTVPKEMTHGQIKRMVEGAMATRILESLELRRDGGVRQGGPTSIEADVPAEMVQVEDIRTCGRSILPASMRPPLPFTGPVGFPKRD